MKNTFFVIILLCIFNFAKSQTLTLSGGTLLSVTKTATPYSYISNSQNDISIIYNFEYRYMEQGTGRIFTLTNKSSGIIFSYWLSTDAIMYYMGGDGSGDNCIFELEKMCISNQTGFYKEICIPQSSNCSQVVLSTTRFTYGRLGSRSDIIEYNGELYFIKNMTVDTFYKLKN